MPPDAPTGAHLDALAGNSRARGLLQSALAQDRVSHAYLFVGPAGVGKTATALAFANDLLEAAGSGPVMAAHPDLWVEDSDAETVSIDAIRIDGKGQPASRVDSIAVDPGAAPGEAATGKPLRRVKGRAATEDSSADIRAAFDLAPRAAPPQTLKAFLSLKGMRSDRQVAVMARAERLSETAAAAILKTIEEPPAGAVIVLAAETADLLPLTIRSRCQEVEFSPLSRAEMQAFAAAHGMDVDGSAIDMAAGCPGRLVRLLADPAEVGRREGYAAELLGMRGASWLDIVTLGARFASPDSRANRVAARNALEVWEEQLRTITLRAAETGMAEPDSVWESLDLDDLTGLWESAREAQDRVRNNVNPRLVVEILLADVARGRSMTVGGVGASLLDGGAWRDVSIP